MNNIITPFKNSSTRHWVTLFMDCYWEIVKIVGLNKNNFQQQHFRDSLCLFNSSVKNSGAIMFCPNPFKLWSMSNLNFSSESNQTVAFLQNT